VHRWRRAVGLLAATAAVATVLVHAGGALGSARAAVKPLVFGIYPGGAAGTVGPSGPVVPEDLAAQLNALRTLRVPGRPFVLHLYATYAGPGSASAEAQMGRLIAAYAAAGFQTELVLSYRPADRRPSADVAGFVSFVRAAVRSLGPTRGFRSVQVTNEAAIVDAPNAADGYYPGVVDALVRGVLAAKSAARANGLRRLTVGFNWAYAEGAAQASFWRRLARGGPRFGDALDWIGLDLYPGTWGPAAAGPDLAAVTTRTTVDAITALRKFLPLARIRDDIPLHIAENGYPTGAGRTPSMQQTVMRSAIRVIDSRRGIDHITDYRWFDLRDANSSTPSFEDHYGLMTDRYVPKPAFETFRSLVATLGR
jgi:hypothetical protein